MKDIICTAHLKLKVLTAGFMVAEVPIGSL